MKENYYQEKDIHMLIFHKANIQETKYHLLALILSVFQKKKKSFQRTEKNSDKNV